MTENGETLGTCTEDGLEVEIGVIEDDGSPLGIVGTKEGLSVNDRPRQAHDLPTL